MTKCVKIGQKHLKPGEGNPGRQGRGMASVLVHEFRTCRNIKSRANPDAQCKFPAIHGDYCSRHYKNPRPFTKIVDSPRVYTRTEHIASRKIQNMWRRMSPLLRYRLQGPAANAPDLATNETELYTLDQTAQIPLVYRMSFADKRKTIWLFDLRTLVHSMGTGFPSQNPYTRDDLTEQTKLRIHTRISWLRARKYHILHMNTDVLTPVQLWNQAVLDIFLKIEALGYYVSCDWYHALNTLEHLIFYRKLYELWNWRLNLTRAQKEVIVPGHMSGPTRIFRFDPGDVIDKGRAWWEKQNLNLISAFISRAQDKENKKLGAMYVLMALVQVSPTAARALPWIVENL